MFWVMAVLTAVCPPLRITFQARALCCSTEGAGAQVIKKQDTLKGTSGGSCCGRTPRKGVFPPSNSSVISLWCPQKGVCIRSAWLGLEIPITEDPELLGVVGHYL